MLVSCFEFVFFKQEKVVLRYRRQMHDIYCILYVFIQGHIMYQKPERHTASCAGEKKSCENAEVKSSSGGFTFLF